MYLNIITMANTTGTKCDQSGIYQCSTHPSYTIALSKGETFPPCQSGSAHGTTWILVRKA